jgi:alpha-tubulin suppressor-like RCC1 family protein
LSIVDIACGMYHAIALDEHGRVHTWGRQCDGQLGNLCMPRYIAPKECKSGGAGDGKQSEIALTN